MPVYAQIRPDGEHWFIETSATTGLQAPLRSINKEQLVSAAFSLGRALCRGSGEGFSWVDFCRWTPNEQYGMEKHTDDTLQLAFTRFGVAVLKNWEEIFVPGSRLEGERPVLIYDHEAWSFSFCDAAHFVTERQAWTIFANLFGTKPPPLAEPAPDGEFRDINEYMKRHLPPIGEHDDVPARPRFHNFTELQHWVRSHA